MFMFFLGPEGHTESPVKRPHDPEGSWSWTGPKPPPLPQALTLGAPHHLAGLPLPKGTQGFLWNALKTAPIHLFPPPPSPHIPTVCQAWVTAREMSH